MTNRVFAFLVAGVLVASPLYAFAHDGENKERNNDDTKLLDFRGEARFFGGLGNRGDNNRDGEKHEKKEFKANANTEARIDARISNLEVLIDRIEDSERLSSEEKDRLIDGIEAQIVVLQDLQARIDSGESKSDIKAAIKLAFKGNVHLMPQAAIDAAAERALRIADRMDSFADALEDRIDDARDDGENVSVSVEAHADLAAHLSDARAEANAALDLIADVTLNTDDDDVIAENRRLLMEARENIEDAYAALKAAREEVRIILDDLDIEAEAVIE